MYLGNIIPLNKEKTLVSMIVDKKKIIIVIIIALLVLGNIGFGIGYFLQKAENQKIKEELGNQQMNVKIINFSNLFIEKVLKAKNEVSFEDRLKLENSVRDLSDPTILTLWEKFTESQTQDDAQEAVKNLLDVLIKKISY